MWNWKYFLELLEIKFDVNVLSTRTFWLQCDYMVTVIVAEGCIFFPICSIDGMNHTGCCQSRGIKTSCLGYCSGVMQNDLYDVNCLLDVPAMLTCFKENSLGKKWQTLRFCVSPNPSWMQYCYEFLWEIGKTEVATVTPNWASTMSWSVIESMAWIWKLMSDPEISLCLLFMSMICRYLRVNLHVLVQKCSAAIYASGVVCVE